MSLTLPRFQQSSLLVDQNGLPSVPFHIWWDQFATKIEQGVNDLASIVADISALQATQTTIIADLSAAVADIVTAQAAADAAAADAATAAADAATAQSTANTASTTANNVKRDDGITASYTSPGTVLTASDVGTNCDIVIATHKRGYGDALIKNVTGATLHAASYSTTYYIYYDDLSRAGGAVTYHKTTNANDAMPNKATGRHYVGVVTTPASGGGSSTGGTAPPTGGGGVHDFDIDNSL